MTKYIAKVTFTDEQEVDTEDQDYKDWCAENDIKPDSWDDADIVHDYIRAQYEDGVCGVPTDPDTIEVTKKDEKKP